MLGREVDFAIASGDSDLFEDLVTLPMFQWDRTVLVPEDRPLTRVSNPGLDDIARFPIISYTYSFSDESSLGKTFERAGVEPNVVFTAQDPDVIKHFVRKGMGIGIVACMAFDAEQDSDLVSVSVKGLFPTLTTWVGFRKDRFLSDHMFEFLKLLIPGITRERVAETLDESADSSNVIPLPSFHPVQRHEALGEQFPKCCGGFNL
jgi:LysR family cys regulon transcriptional activator